MIVDRGGLPGNPWRGYQLCLSEIPDGCLHLVVIQDDAILCQNFTQAVEQIVIAQACNVICLFVPGAAGATTHAVMKASAAGIPFVPLAFREFMPVVATIWPVDKARSLMEWAETAKLPGMPRPVRSDDAVCGLWKRECRETVYCTVPSLVQHPDDVDSTIGKRAANGADKGRVAAFYIGDGDPLAIDWGK